MNVRAPTPLHARPFTPLVPRPPERKHPRPFSPCYLPHRPTRRGRCLAWSAALALWGSTSRQGPPIVPGPCARCMRWCTRTTRHFLILGQATRSLLIVYQNIVVYPYTHMLAVQYRPPWPGHSFPSHSSISAQVQDLPQDFRCVGQNEADFGISLPAPSADALTATLYGH